MAPAIYKVFYTDGTTKEGELPEVLDEMEVGDIAMITRIY